MKHCFTITVYDAYWNKSYSIKKNYLLQNEKKKDSKMPIALPRLTAFEQPKLQAAFK